MHFRFLYKLKYFAKPYRIAIINAALPPSPLWDGIVVKIPNSKLEVLNFSQKIE